MFKFVRIVLGGGLLLGLFACGGGNSGSNLTPAGIEGVFAGHTDSPVHGSAFSLGIAESTGPAYLFDQFGVVYVIPTLTSNVTGPATVYAPIGETLANGQKQIDVTLDGSGNATAGGIVGSFTGTDFNGHLGFSPLSPFNGPTTASLIAGDWQGVYLGKGSLAVAITVDGEGSFSGHDADGCQLSGKVARRSESADVFSVVMSSSGSSTLCFGQMAGLAFETDNDLLDNFSDSSGIFYYIVVSNAQGAIVLALKVQ